jgi:hypothetical protein
MASRATDATGAPSSPLLPEDDVLAEMCARYGREVPLGERCVSEGSDGSGSGRKPLLCPVANVVVATAAAAFGVALYANTLSHDFTFDDFAAVQDNADVNWTTPFMSTLVSVVRVSVGGVCCGTDGGIEIRVVVVPCCGWVLHWRTGAMPPQGTANQLKTLRP